MLVVTALTLLGTLSQIALFVVTLRYLKRINRKITDGRQSAHALHMAGVDLRTTAFFHGGIVRQHLEALAQDPDIPANAGMPMSYMLSRTIGDIQVAELAPARNTNIVVCSLALGADYRETVRRCLDSHEAFARKHGYGYALMEQAPIYQGRPPAWFKVPLILKLIAAGHDVLFLDADAMITNNDVPLEQNFSRLANSGRSILITEDEGGVNTGAMFVRSTRNAQRVLDLIWLYDADIYNGTWEQNALKFLMNNFAEVQDQLLIDPRPKNFNSFPVERRLFYQTREQNIWSHGDFVCHFSGIRNQHLKRYIADYAEALN